MGACAAVGCRGAPRELPLSLHAAPCPRYSCPIIASTARSHTRRPLPTSHQHPASAVEFHKWYADLTQALASIIAKKLPGVEGDLGAAAAAARHRCQREAGGLLRKNAFELIASSFNVCSHWAAMLCCCFWVSGGCWLLSCGLKGLQVLIESVL